MELHAPTHRLLLISVFDVCYIGTYTIFSPVNIVHEHVCIRKSFLSGAGKHARVANDSAFMTSDCA